MHRLRLLAAVAFLVLPGCFPIELDVNKKGQILIPRQEGFFLFEPATGKVQKVRDAEGHKPVFARFAPNGKDFLAISEVVGKDFKLKDVKELGPEMLAKLLDPANLFARRFSFALVPLQGGAGREVYRAQDCAYARLSPDGERLAITRLVSKPEGDTNVQVPELHVVAIKDGADKGFPQTVGVMFRWFNDSERVLIVEIKKKCKDEKGFERFYVGDLLVVNILTGKATPLASVAFTSDFHMDLSPDNRKVLMTALRAAKPGVDVEKAGQSKTEADDKAMLFVLDVEGGMIKPTNRQANYAIFSPSGHQVLLGAPLEQAFDSGFKVHIFDGAITKSKPLADTLPRPSTMSFSGDGTLYPGWIDEKTVFYFDERAVYGTAGKSLSLMTIGANGDGRRCVQPLIDLEAVRTEK